MDQDVTHRTPATTPAKTAFDGLLLAVEDRHGGTLLRMRDAGRTGRCSFPTGSPLAEGTETFVARR